MRTIVVVLNREARLRSLGYQRRDHWMWSVPWYVQIDEHSTKVGWHANADLKQQIGPQGVRSSLGNAPDRPARPSSMPGATRVDDRSGNSDGQPTDGALGHPRDAKRSPGNGSCDGGVA